MVAARIVYLAVGSNEALHTQALYAMLSALAWNGNAQVHLFTDQAGFYSPISERIVFEAFSATMPSLMSAKPVATFQLKLAAIEAMTRRFPDNLILFCDADTFFTAPANDLLAELEAGRFVMHRREYSVSTYPLAQTAKIRRALRRAGMMAAAMAQDPALPMWNSGVIGLPAGNAAVITQAAALLGKLGPLLPPHYPAEQFCVGMAMPPERLRFSAEGCVFHYWFQKDEYSRAIAARLADWSHLPLQEKLQRLRSNPLALAAPPQKLHWWEKILIRVHLRSRPEDTRGLPRTEKRARIIAGPQ